MTQKIKTHENFSKNFKKNFLKKGYKKKSFLLCEWNLLRDFDSVRLNNSRTLSKSERKLKKAVRHLFLFRALRFAGSMLVVNSC